MRKFKRDNFNDIFNRYSGVDSDRLLDIALGKTDYSPKIIKEEVDPYWSAEDFNYLSFGQFISANLQKKNKNIFELENVVKEFNYKAEDILDDDILPWNIEYKVLSLIKELLELNSKEFFDVIKEHPISEDKLNPRKFSDFAARTTNDLSSGEREEELEHSLLKVALEKENRKREKYLKALQKNI